MKIQGVTVNRVRAFAFALLGTLTALGQAQEVGKPLVDSGLAKVLSFEAEHQGGTPGGWGGGPPETIFLDEKVVHGGRWSARLERGATVPEGFSAISKMIPLDFAGQKIELRGFLRTEDVSGFVGLWLREDGEGGSVAFDNMQSKGIKGSHDWAEYSIVLPLRPEARQVVLGALMSGTGKLWVDDLQLLVDGKPIWEAPKAVRPKTAADMDHAFDKGSGIAAVGFSKVQTESLALLGRVWGFLKYHHPAVTAGKHHWDYELFRVMPQILAARNRASANRVLVKWIDGLGVVPKSNPSASLELPDLHLRPDLRWIGEETRLGRDLSNRLHNIHDNRVPGKQHYVSFMPGVGNPAFDHEKAYPDLKIPDPGYQLLGLFRFWNIIEYWFPYRDLHGEDWPGVLAEFVPRIGLAKDPQDYQREMMALIARVHDTHANLWSSLGVRPPVGECGLPVTVRFVNGRAVITQVDAGEAGRASGLRIGDVIQDLDGVPIHLSLKEWSPYYAASNDPTRLRDLGMALTKGECGPAKLRIEREGSNEPIEITASRVKSAAENGGGFTHDRPGDTFQLLSKDVAYLKLSSAKAADAEKYVESAKGTKGLIIDIRNYPSEFMVFALGSLLVEKETEFASFTTGDASNPGAFHWTKTVSLKPGKAHYSGRVVILVDETSQSQAEYTTMAFRSAPGAKVVGSTTAGADGNISPIPLPGGLRSMISGIGVFYPDRRPTQRIGIVADVEVKPTIAGIRAGRDEVLEEAIRQILGPSTPPEAIASLLRK